MKILVPIKRVVDANVRVRVKADNSGVETHAVKHVINPFCEIAIEEALRLKESGVASEVVAVSIGSDDCQEQLRTALALGVDRAMHIHTEQSLQPLAIAKVLHHIAENEQPELVILGKQSIDGDNNQTGQMLAALTGMPQGTFASEVTIGSEDAGSEVLVTREVDGGLQQLALTLPAIITTDLRLNEPRYVSLPNMMKAKRKPIEKMDVAELGIDVADRLTTVSVTNPPERAAGVIVGNVGELVDKLKAEAGVLS